MRLWGWKGEDLRSYCLDHQDKLIKIFVYNEVSGFYLLYVSKKSPPLGSQNTKGPAKHGLAEGRTEARVEAHYHISELKQKSSYI